MKIKLSNIDSISILSRKDLEKLIPVKRTGKALNYGQGEGQFQIDHTVWGIYLTSDKKYCLQYEEGSLEWTEFNELCSELLDHIRSAFNPELTYSVEGALNHYAEHEKYSVGE